MLHNVLALLTQQTMNAYDAGGRTGESKDNSQLVLGLCRLEDPTGIITVPARTDLPEHLRMLNAQLSDGIVVAARSFYDNKPLVDIIADFKRKYGGSGGALQGDNYHSAEFATSSKGRLVCELSR